MTYSDFLNYLSAGVNLFINSLTSVAQSLINNYIYVTLLGIVIFFSLFSLVIYFISIIRNNNKTDYDNVINRKKRHDYDLIIRSNIEYK